MSRPDLGGTYLVIALLVFLAVAAGLVLGSWLF